VGGRHSPSAVGGEGISRLDDAPRLAHSSARCVGDDLMVEAAVVYPPRRRA